MEIQHVVSIGQRKVRVPDRNRTHDLPYTGLFIQNLELETWQ